MPASVCTCRRAIDAVLRRLALLQACSRDWERERHHHEGERTAGEVPLGSQPENEGRKGADARCPAVRSVRALDVEDEIFRESKRCEYLPTPDQFSERATMQGPRFGLHANEKKYKTGINLGHELRELVPVLLYRKYFAGTMKHEIPRQCRAIETEFEVLAERMQVMDEIREALETTPEHKVKVPSIFSVPRLTDDLKCMKEQADIITKMAGERAANGTVYSVAAMQKEFKESHLTTLGEVLKGRERMHEQYLKRVQKTIVEAYLVKKH